MLAIGDKLNQDILYKVGDIVLFNQNKECGYIIEVLKDLVKVVSEKG